jgi:tetratricopeptide (TPR) repeat protein
MVSLKQEKFKLAEYYFRKAVEINPYNPILQTYVAMVVQKDPNRLLEALEIYRTAKVEPSYSLQSAQIYFELKDYQQAKTIEELDVARFVQVDLPKTKQEMSQSFSWVKEGESFSQTCEQVILTRHNLTLRYHDKTQAIVRPISQACTEIMSSTGFSQWIRTQEQYAKEILVDVYLKEVRRLGLLAADDCRIRNSSNVVLEFLRKRAQLACFTVEWRGVISKSWSQAIRETGIRTITQAQIRQETDSRVDQINQEIKEQKF